MTSQPSTIYCINHPNVETSLRCNRCERPICARCAIQTPTGYRCPDCVRSQQKVFATAIWFDYIAAFLIAGVLTYIGSLLVPRVGFFTIFLAPIAGGIVAEAIRFAVRRRRSKQLSQLSAGAAALGSLVPIVFNLLTGLPILSMLWPMIWQIAFTLVVTSTVYYRLAGIRL